VSLNATVSIMIIEHMQAIYTMFTRTQLKSGYTVHTDQESCRKYI